VTGAPRLAGGRVTLRPGTREDVAILHDILSDPSVTRWWGEPESPEFISTCLRGESEERLLVIEVDAAVAGGIQYVEEREPMYRHAGIDLFLSRRGFRAVGIMRPYERGMDGVFHDGPLMDLLAENIGERYYRRAPDSWPSPQGRSA
jgi:aminoglycoside 6'-N-acetyltransferase